MEGELTRWLVDAVRRNDPDETKEMAARVASFAGDQTELARHVFFFLVDEPPFYTDGDHDAVVRLFDPSSGSPLRLYGDDSLTFEPLLDALLGLHREPANESIVRLFRTLRGFGLDLERVRLHGSTFQLYVLNWMWYVSDVVFEWMMEGLTARALEASSRLTYAMPYSQTIVALRCAVRGERPRSYARAARLMRVFTEDPTYRSDTPTRMMGSVEIATEIPALRESALKMLDALRPVYAPWQAAQFALAMVPSAQAAPNELPRLLLVVDGDNVVKRTVRGYVKDFLM